MPDLGKVDVVEGEVEEEGLGGLLEHELLRKLRVPARHFTSTSANKQRNKEAKKQTSEQTKYKTSKQANRQTSK